MSLHLAEKQTINEETRTNNLTHHNKWHVSFKIIVSHHDVLISAFSGLHILFWTVARFILWLSRLYWVYFLGFLFLYFCPLVNVILSSCFFSFWPQENSQAEHSEAARRRLPQMASCGLINRAVSSNTVYCWRPWLLLFRPTNQTDPCSRLHLTGAFNQQKTIKLYLESIFFHIGLLAS